MAPGKQQGLLSIYMVYNSLQQSLHGWQQFTTVLTNKAVWDFMKLTTVHEHVQILQSIATCIWSSDECPLCNTAIMFLCLQLGTPIPCGFSCYWNTVQPSCSYVFNLELPSLVVSAVAETQCSHQLVMYPSWTPIPFGFSCCRNTVQPSTCHVSILNSHPLWFQLLPKHSAAINLSCIRLELPSSVVSAVAETQCSHQLVMYPSWTPIPCGFSCCRNTVQPSTCHVSILNSHPLWFQLLPKHSAAINLSCIHLELPSSVVSAVAETQCSHQLVSILNSHPLWFQLLPKHSAAINLSCIHLELPSSVVSAVAETQCSHQLVMYPSWTPIPCGFSCCRNTVQPSTCHVSILNSHPLWFQLLPKHSAAINLSCIHLELPSSVVSAVAETQCSHQLVSILNSHPLWFQLLPKHSAAINLSCIHLELPSSVVSAVAETQCSHQLVMYPSWTPIPCGFSCCRNTVQPSTCHVSILNSHPLWFQLLPKHSAAINLSCIHRELPSSVVSAVAETQCSHQLVMYPSWTPILCGFSCCRNTVQPSTCHVSILNSHPLWFQLLPKHSAAINLSCLHLELPSSVVSAVAETQCSHQLVMSPSWTPILCGFSCCRNTVQPSTCHVSILNSHPLWFQLLPKHSAAINLSCIHLELPSLLVSAVAETQCSHQLVMYPSWTPILCGFSCCRNTVMYPSWTPILCGFSCCRNTVMYPSWTPILCGFSCCRNTVPPSTCHVFILNSQPLWFQLLPKHSAAINLSCIHLELPSSVVSAVAETQSCIHLELPSSVVSAVAETQSCIHLELPSSVVSAVAETQCRHHPGSGAEEEGQRQEGERTGETGTGECA